MLAAMPSALEARYDTYGFLAELLSFPTKELAKAIASSDVSATLQEFAGALPYSINERYLDGLGTELGFADLQAEYIRLFDVPDRGSSCPLYTGVYARARRDAMEELLRFYRYFGLTLSPSSHDLPDSVPTVLEFLQFLGLREEASIAARQADLARQARAAQRDVIDRHVLPWAAQTARRLTPRDPHPFYAAVVGFSEAFLRADLAFLHADTG